MISGFYKVNEITYSDYTQGIFFNPKTKEEFGMILDGVSIFSLEPINDYVRSIWNKEREIVLGDTVKVVRGKKIPVNTVGTVTRIYPIYNKYNNKVCDYIEIDGIFSTNRDNLRLVIT